MGKAKCKERINEVECIELPCVVCEGKGCKECNDLGYQKHTTCPLDIIPPDVYEVVEAAELFGKGLPPVAGGQLDQSKGFVEASRFCFREENYWKNRLGILNG